jgi:hypothetical protein
MPPLRLYRAATLLLWALAVWNSIACRGLFWDGASFLVNVVDFGRFYDFYYPARAHVGWVTQLPLLAAVHLGVSDMHVLAMIQSAGLFALPAGLYHLALARTRRDPVLLSIVLAAIAVVYLPTSFFIIGEYNAAYAAVTAAMAVVATADGLRRRDGMILLLLLGALCLRSYEAMVYLGPLVAMAILWRTWRRQGRVDGIARLLGTVAALAFIGGALVSGITMVTYWNHPHFALVRQAVTDFWQNLQFMIPLVGFAIFTVLCVATPRWLLSRAPVLLIGLAAVLLVVVPWVREIRPQALLFPPSHYVARTAAGCVLWAMLLAMWACCLFRHSPLALFACLRRPEVGRRIATAMIVLVVAAAVPDLWLTRLWGGYLDYVRSVVTAQTGLIPEQSLPMDAWPQSLFNQDWTQPALSAALRRSPDDAIIVADPRSGSQFDPACGTLPRLIGYRWP